MRKTLITTCLFIFFGSSLLAQAPTKSSDYKIKKENLKTSTAELIAIFNDAINAPTKYNIYVKTYLQNKTFPEKESFSKQKWNANLKDWINNNPALIDQLLSDRKTAHINLYGPRKK